MRPRLAISFCVVAFAFGFMFGMEYEQKSALAVDVLQLPDLRIDQAIYQDALARTQNATTRRHIQSQLNIIEGNIARAEGR